MMKKIVVGTLLLIAGTAISQTTQQKMAEAKSKSQSTATTQTPVKPKTLSLDASNPNYRKEQKKYTGPDRDFAPRKTKPGSRTDEGKKKQ